MITKFVLEVDNELSYSLLAPDVNFDHLNTLELAVIETYLRYNWRAVREAMARKEEPIDRVQKDPLENWGPSRDF
jgi:hypothetical protein